MASLWRLTEEAPRAGYGLGTSGFPAKPGKGSHRKYIHPDGRQFVLSVKDGDDAKPYQEKQVTKLVKR